MKHKTTLQTNGDEHGAIYHLVSALAQLLAALSFVAMLFAFVWLANAM